MAKAYLARARDPLISYEVIPPKRGGSVEDVLGVVADLMRFEPPFVDVTSHAAHALSLSQSTRSILWTWPRCDRC